MPVATPVCLPTGPAATAASAPSVSRPFSIPSTLLRVLKTRIMSVDCAPICQPTLPPVIVTNAGLLHESSSCRTTMMPLPRLTPTPNAAFMTLGMTATAYACDSKARGIVFSGIRRSCSRTSAASPTRFSSLDVASLVLENSRANSVARTGRSILFMMVWISGSL